jgi:hypothetical protein
MTLIERLRIAATDDHERGCQGRNFACTCGYDAATQIACQDAARALEAADAAISALSKLASEHQWTDRQIQALAAYRAATKGER